MNKRYISKLITDIEHSILKWFKPLPHLPREARTWLADNLWWITALGSIVVAIAAFATLVNIFAYLSFLGNAASYAGIYNAPVYSALWLVDTLVLLAVLCLLAYLYGKAYGPLRRMRADGWRLLFIALLVGVARAVIAAVLSLNPVIAVYTLLASGIAMAVAAYFLFEVRTYFVKSAK